MSFFILALFIILNFFIVFYYDRYEKFFKIIDRPDGIRKNHIHEVKIFGGIILIINLVLLGLLSFTDLNNFIFKDIIFNDKSSYITFFFFAFLFFILGFYDDIFDINASRKLILCSIIFFTAIQLNNDLSINSFHLDIIDTTFELGVFSNFFSILCFLLLLNSLNMFDGINLQVGLFCIIVFFIFYLLEVQQLISLIMIISLIGYIFLNAKNKIFLGDGGVYLISFIITFILILQNNYKEPILSPELIFQILVIPGIDMFRLFSHRLINKKNPFSSDRQHLHHLLSNYHNLYITTLLIQLMIIIPILLGLYVMHLKYSILISIITYSIFYIAYKNKT